jgi:hypothetical protein
VAVPAIDENSGEWRENECRNLPEESHDAEEKH